MFLKTSNQRKCTFTVVVTRNEAVGVDKGRKTPPTLLHTLSTTIFFLALSFSSKTLTSSLEFFMDDECCSLPKRSEKWMPLSFKTYLFKYTFSSKQHYSLLVTSTVLVQTLSLIYLNWNPYMDIFKVCNTPKWRVIKFTNSFR